MRVKFMGHTQLQQAAQYITDGDYELQFKVRVNNANAAVDSNVIEKITVDVPNDKITITKIVGHSAAVSIEAKILGVKDYDVSGVTSKKYSFSLETAERTTLAGIITGVGADELKSTSYINMIVERKTTVVVAKMREVVTPAVVGPPPTDAKLKFESFLETMDTDQKKACITHFLNEAETALIRLKKDKRVDFRTQTEGIYDILSENDYNTKAKSTGANGTQGHIPLIGPNQYIYIDFLDWANHTSLATLNASFADVLTELSFYNAAKDQGNISKNTKSYKVAQSFPHTPDDFKDKNFVDPTDDAKSFGFGTVTTLFDDFGFQQASYTAGAAGAAGTFKYGRGSSEVTILEANKDTLPVNIYLSKKNNPHKKDQFDKNILELLQNTIVAKTPAQKYYKDGLYLPLHYSHLKKFVKKAGPKGVDETVLLKGLKQPGGGAPATDLYTLHSKVVDTTTHKSRASVFSTVTSHATTGVSTVNETPNFADYIWFLVFVNAETSRHPQWNFMARMALEGVQIGLLEFDNLTNPRTNVGYIPKSHGAVATMEEYKDRFFQKELTLVLLEDLIDKEGTIKTNLEGNKTTYDLDMVGYNWLDFAGKATKFSKRLEDINVQVETGKTLMDAEKTAMDSASGASKDFADQRKPLLEALITIYNTHWTAHAFTTVKSDYDAATTAIMGFANKIVSQVGGTPQVFTPIDPTTVPAKVSILEKWGSTDKKDFTLNFDVTDFNTKVNAYLGEYKAIRKSAAELLKTYWNWIALFQFDKAFIEGAGGVSKGDGTHLKKLDDEVAKADPDFDQIGAHTTALDLEKKAWEAQKAAAITTCTEYATWSTKANELKTVVLPFFTAERTGLDTAGIKTKLSTFGEAYNDLKAACNTAIDAYNTPPAPPTPPAEEDGGGEAGESGGESAGEAAGEDTKAKDLQVALINFLDKVFADTIALQSTSNTKLNTNYDTVQPVETTHKAAVQTHKEDITKFTDISGAITSFFAEEKNFLDNVNTTKKYLDKYDGVVAVDGLTSFISALNTCVKTKENNTTITGSYTCPDSDAMGINIDIKPDDINLKIRGMADKKKAILLAALEIQIKTCDNMLAIQQHIDGLEKAFNKLIDDAIGAFDKKSTPAAGKIDGTIDLSENYFGRWANGVAVYLMYHYLKGGYDLEELKVRKYEAATLKDPADKANVIDKMMTWSTEKYGLQSLLQHIPINDPV